MKSKYFKSHVAGTADKELADAYNVLRAEIRKLQLRMTNEKNPLSEYAKTSYDEAFAESRTAYVIGENQRIGTDLVKAYDFILQFLNKKYAI